MIHLMIPTPAMEQEAMAFKQAFYNAGERVICGSYKLDNERYSYADWLAILESNRSPETADPKFGVSDTFFARNEEGKLVGIINVRYELTPFYQNSGHIGYSVVPDQRGKGYATQMLLAVLEKARENGLPEVKLVCKAKNIASKKTMQKAGAALFRVFGEGDDQKEEYRIIL
jgi:predicted acetyltransferase